MVHHVLSDAFLKLLLLRQLLLMMMMMWKRVTWSAKLKIAFCDRLLAVSRRTKRVSAPFNVCVLHLHASFSPFVCVRTNQRRLMALGKSCTQGAKKNLRTQLNKRKEQHMCCTAMVHKELRNVSLLSLRLRTRMAAAMAKHTSCVLRIASFCAEIVYWLRTRCWCSVRFVFFFSTYLQKMIVGQ